MPEVRGLRVITAGSMCYVFHSIYLFRDKNSSFLVNSQRYIYFDDVKTGGSDGNPNDCVINIGGKCKT